MIIKNADVYNEKSGFIKVDIYIRNDKIVEPFEEQKNVIDASGLYAIPGLTDIHFHGCVGYDFCDGTKQALEKIALYQATNGVTTICPASMTLPEEELEKIFVNASKYNNKTGAILCGIHMEGPFISTEKKGAQNESYIAKPDIELLRRLNEASGNLIKIVSLAPEIQGSMDFISELKNEVVISIAHTSADYDTAMEAFKRGAQNVTHLYNAMPPFKHREPGVIGAAFDTPHSYVELIADGLHVHPSTVRATFKMFGEDRLILVSDSMMAAGMPEGEYSLGGQKVMVYNNKAVLSDGTIAGSITNLMDCMKNCVLNMGIPLEQAVKCAAVNPAKAIGIYDLYGSITPGKIANIVLMDKKLDIRAVIIKGKEFKRKVYK